MPSSYTQTGIELIATGEQSGTWGTTTNTNLQIVDRLTNGVGAISLSGTTHTLTTSDGTHCLTASIRCLCLVAAQAARTR
jgi:hypothetical protein